VFHKIQAKNIFSWESLDYTFPNGLSQITGQNLDDGTNEAIGKSSIFNILCWALFGRIPKDVRIDEVIRQGQKSCEALVLLEDGYSVLRTRNPNRLILVTPKGQSIIGKDAKETQILIDKHLGLTFELFCQTVYFSQNQDKKFISINDTEKAKILSDIQDLEAYDKARVKCQAQIKELTTDRIQIENQIKQYQLQLKEKSNFLKYLEESILKFEEKKEKELAEITEEKKGIEEELASLVGIEDARQEATAQLNLLHESTANAKEARNLKNQITAVLKEPNYLCDHCGKVSNGKHKEERLLALNKELDKYGDLKDANLQQLNFEVSQKIHDLKILDDLYYRKRDLLEKFKSLELKEKKIQGGFADREAQKIEETQKECSKVSNEINKLDQIIMEIHKKVNDYEILREDFKNIKAKVFKTLLLDLSIKSTNYALELFEMPIKISFTNDLDSGNLSKIETIVTLHGVERSVGLLSGGQTRRVQLAVDLALSEIVSKRAQKSINFRIFDEATKDLSVPSILRFIGILEQLPGKTLIVDHSELIKPVINSECKLQFKDGISTLLD
jgi:DNA repair exonuclease SbcCD ATPase subunit